MADQGNRAGRGGRAAAAAANQDANDQAAAQQAAINQATAIQQLVANAIAAQAAQIPPAQVQQAPVQVAPVFALFPGAAMPNYLDYSTSEARKIFKNATEAIDDPFDMKSEDLQQFLDEVKQRSKRYNWDDVLSVPDTNGVNRDLTTAYGLLTLQDCRTHATTYVAAQTRQAQNSVMLEQFIRASLSKTAKNIIIQSQEQYTINGTASGACLLKFVIGKSMVDTQATIHVLRLAITKLPDKMNELNSDIRSFNNYVLQVKNALLARGEVVGELLTHLFEAYATASDPDFSSYMRLERTAFGTGKQQYTVEELMSAALTTYDLRKQSGQWVSPGGNKFTEEKFVALQAQVNKFTSRNNQKEHDSKKKNNGTQGSNTSAQNTSGAQDSGKASRDKEFAWKKKPPKEGESSTKKGKDKNGVERDYHWCPKHKAWTLHSANECFKGKQGRKSKSNNETPTLVANSATATNVTQGEYEDNSSQSSQE
jgi:hypothetical protein